MQDDDDDDDDDAVSKCHQEDKGQILVLSKGISNIVEI